MELLDKTWEYFTKLPKLISEYQTYSYPLLTVLLVGGILVVAIHGYRKWRTGQGLPSSYVVFGCVLAFLSLSGFFLKGMGDRERKREAENLRQGFISQYRAKAGEHRLLVFDFTLPPTLKAEDQDKLLNRMDLLVASMSQALIEDLPVAFRQPRVVRVPTTASPWRGGIGQQNFDEIGRELNAFEIMWGNVHEQGTVATAFLGLTSSLGPDLNARVIALREWPLDQDPRRENQFGDGYYRLLGLVTLGMALDTYGRAQQAQGAERARLFVLAAEEIRAAQTAVVNRRDDPMLKSTLYGPQVSKFYESAVKEGGVSP
jgi:hypothetical protein